jgi:hypothetical protein
MAKTQSPKSLNTKTISRWFPQWVFPAVIVMAVVTVWLRLSIVRTTYEIDQTTQEIRALQQAREQTELKLTGTRSPRKLETLARSKFNLSQPKPEQVIYMKEASR